jgi:hypothetical protein
MDTKPLALSVVVDRSPCPPIRGLGLGSIRECPSSYCIFFLSSPLLPESNNPETDLLEPAPCVCMYGYALNAMVSGQDLGNWLSPTG